MRPIVEYSGRAHLVSTWKVDTLTWKYSNRQVTYDRILPFSRYAQFSQFLFEQNINTVSVGYSDLGFGYSGRAAYSDLYPNGT